MPFSCSKRSTGICVVLGQQKTPQSIPANMLPVCSSLQPRICPHLIHLVTKDSSGRLLAGPVIHPCGTPEASHLRHHNSITRKQYDVSWLTPSGQQIVITNGNPRFMEPIVPV